MNILQSQSSKFNIIRNEIKNLKSFEDLINYIPNKSINRFAELMLILLIISPFFIIGIKAIVNITIDSPLFIDHYTYWNILLQQIGLLGIFVGLIHFIKIVFVKPGIQIPKILQNNLSALYLLLMLFFSTLSAVFSDNHDISFWGTYFRKDGLLSYYAYAGIFICGYLIKDRSKMMKIIKLFIISSVILSLIMLINNNILNVTLGLYGRSSVFYNINHFGYYLTLSILSSVLLILIHNNGVKVQILHYGVFLLLVITLITNKSFGPFLAIFCTLLILLFLSYMGFCKRKNRVLIILTLFISTSVFMNLKTGFLLREVSQLNNGVENILFEDENAGSAGSGRWKLWVNGIRFVTEKPLFGYGPDNLGERYLLEDIRNDRPHNEIIQFAASLGIPAALSYILSIFFHVREYFICRKTLSPFEIGLFAIIMAYLISSMFGNTMFYTTPYFFMFLGLSLRNIRNRFREC